MNFLLMSDDFVLRFSSIFSPFFYQFWGHTAMGMGGVEFGAATQDLTSDMFEGYRVGAGTMPIKIQQVTQHQSRSSWCHFLAYMGGDGTIYESRSNKWHFLGKRGGGENANQNTATYVSWCIWAGWGQYQSRCSK